MVDVTVSNQAVAELRGDLQAIEILLQRAKGTYWRSWEYPPISIDAKKRLWNARSRLITRISTQLGITDPNSVESVVVRELIGLASKGVEGL